MTRWLTHLLACALVATLIGCAHPITMNPDLGLVKADGGSVIDKTVGLHIPESIKAVEVTTAGGGGDKVRYFPYRDMEAGIYKALGEVFRSVTKVANPADAGALAASGVQLLVTPTISTTSSSESIVTWPPTQFGVELTCTVVDAKGAPVATVRASGYGRATFDEFKSNFSLAAVRASNDALRLLIKALQESPALRQ